MTSSSRFRYPSREERRAVEQAESNPATASVDDAATQGEAAAPRSRVAEGKMPPTFHLWDETRFALYTAQWELDMTLLEIGEAAIRQYLEGEGITVAEPGTGTVRRRRRRNVRGPAPRQYRREIL